MELVQLVLGQQSTVLGFLDAQPFLYDVCSVDVVPSHPNPRLLVLEANIRAIKPIFMGASDFLPCIVASFSYGC
jgi:hypothetical protein